MNEQDKIDRLMMDVACLLISVKYIEQQLTDIPKKVTTLEASVGLLSKICWCIGSTVIGAIVLAIIGLIIV